MSTHQLWVKQPLTVYIANNHNLLVKLVLCGAYSADAVIYKGD